MPPIPAAQATHRSVRNRSPFRPSCSRHASTAGGILTMRRRSGVTSSSRSTVCAYLRAGGRGGVGLLPLVVHAQATLRAPMHTCACASMPTPPLRKKEHAKPPPAWLGPAPPQHAPLQHAARTRQVEERGLAGEDVVPGGQQPAVLPKLACGRTGGAAASLGCTAQGLATAAKQAVHPLACSSSAAMTAGASQSAMRHGRCRRQRLGPAPPPARTREALLEAQHVGIHVVQALPQQGLALVPPVHHAADVERGDREGRAGARLRRRHRGPPAAPPAKQPPDRALGHPGDGCQAQQGAQGGEAGERGGGGGHQSGDRQRGRRSWLLHRRVLRAGRAPRGCTWNCASGREPLATCLSEHFGAAPWPSIAPG